MTNERLGIKLEAIDATKKGLDSADKNLDKLKRKNESVFAGMSKALGAAFAAEKVKQFFSQSLKAATDANPKMKAIAEGLGDTWRGFQSAIGASILSNQEFMQSISWLAEKVLPVVLTQFKNLMELINRLVSVLKIATNGWRMLFRAIKGESVADLIKENASLWESVTSPEGFSLAPTAFKPVKGKPTGTTKKQEPFDPLKAAGIERRSGLAATGQDIDAMNRRGAQLIDFDKYMVGLQDAFKGTALQVAPMSKVDRDAIIARALGSGADWAWRDHIQHELLPEMQEAFSSTITQGITDGFSEGIEAAIESGNLGEGLKVLAGSMVSALGSAFKQVGQIALAGSLLLQKLMAALKSFSPAASVAASLGLIALGSVISGASKRIFGSMGSGASGGSLGRVGSFNTSFADNYSGQPINYIIQGDRYLDTTNPRIKRDLARANESLGRRRVTFTHQP